MKTHDLHLDVNFLGQVLNPDGSVVRTFKGTMRLHLGGNGLTTEGLTDILQKYFKGSSYTAAWFMGLINNSPSPSLSAADTMASHAGWSESEDYTEGTRPAITFANASGGSIASSGNIDFSIDDTVTIFGAFIVANSTKGGTTGVLWGTGGFDSPQALESGQTLRINPYTVTAAEAA